MKRPNFFILGAPKCGTTSLAYWLSRHPEIFMSDPKEPFYFNTDLGPSLITREEDYLELFRHAGPRHRIIGEATTYNLYSKVAVPAILEFCSRPRFLVMLRNPVDMAYSLHNEHHYRGYEPEPDFKKAWELQEDRRQGRNLPLLVKDPEGLLYSDACSLGHQVERLYGLVSRQQVMVLTLDELQADPRKAYLEILAFLGLKDDGRQDFPVLNTAKGDRNRLLKWVTFLAIRAKTRLGIRMRFGIHRRLKARNTIQHNRARLDPGFREQLIDHFREDVKLLSRLTGKNLEHWKEPELFSTSSGPGK